MAETTRSAGRQIIANPGPYEAIVVSNLDSTYMGSLEVELLKKVAGGNNPEESGQTYIVRYLAPFYGITPAVGMSANSSYEHAQKSYGMWMVPPDIGTRVLVIFAEGDPSKGYWIGCIPDRYMNFMTPGNAATELTLPDTPNALKGKKLPTAEYNKVTERAVGNDQTKYLKPFHKEFVQSLEVQGLLLDEVRGVTTSSARRESPSSVFGISTPGPADKRDGAPKAPVGQRFTKAVIPVNRLGGSSFVMDDGDDKFLRKTHASEGPYAYASKEAADPDGDPTIPQNELIRIKTRTGHQILLHNSEDLIYIGNARGTAWVELTSDGKIDIHAQDSISIQTENDLNITAERDINIEAGRNISMKATARFSDDLLYDEDGYECGRIQFESRFNYNLEIGANGRVTTKRYYDNKQEININGNMDVHVHGNSISNIGTGVSDDVDAEHYYHVTTTGNEIRKTTLDKHVTVDETVHETIGSHLDINVGGHTYHTAAENMELYSEKQVLITSDSTTEIQAGANIIIDAFPDIHLNGPAATAAQTAVKADPPRDAILVDPLGKIKLPRIMPGQTLFDPDADIYETIVPRAPQHEPWPHHENLNPLFYKRTETDREMIALYDKRYDDGEILYTVSEVADTFRKGTTDRDANTAPSNAGSVASRTNTDTKQATTASASTGNYGKGSCNGPVQPALTTSTIIGTIKGFTKAETAAYLNAIGERESGMRYLCTNSIGYVGKYQLGYMALIDIGYIKNIPSARSFSALDDPKVWTGKNGAVSKQAFLDNVENCQEKAMLLYTNINYGYLISKSPLFKEKKDEDKPFAGGLLAISHLLGAGAASTWAKTGNERTDAYGTKGSTYYKIGSRAIMTA